MRILKFASGAAVASALLLGGATAALAQTTTYPSGTGMVTTTVVGNTQTSSMTPTTSPSGTFTPGIPNTGAGGDSAATVLLLTATAAVAAVGVTYLMRQRYAR